jgi:hypothetical protein
MLSIFGVSIVLYFIKILSGSRNTVLYSSCFFCLKVRDSPQYHLIKACVHKNLGNHEECIKTLNTAMALPGVKKASKARNTFLVRN